MNVVKDNLISDYIRTYKRLSEQHKISVEQVIMADLCLGIKDLVKEISKLNDTTDKSPSQHGRF